MDRMKSERELAAAVALLFADFSGEAMDGRFASRSFRAGLRDSIRPILADVHWQAGNKLAGLADYSPGRDAIRAASKWSNAYAQRLADQITNTTSEALARALANPDPQARREAIDRILGRERAENISAGEVTAGISRGESDAAETIRNETGTRLVPLWEIEDRDACPVCRPLDGTTRSIWGRRFPLGPPAHPVCRCGLRWGIHVGGGRFSMLESVGVRRDFWFVAEAFDPSQPRDDHGRWVESGGKKTERTSI